MSADFNFSMSYILKRKTKAVFMNKLCIVTRNSGTYFVRRLTEEVRDILLWDPWKQPGLPEAENFLVRTTSVYRDDRDLDLLKGTQKKVINPVETHELLRDK